MSFRGGQGTAYRLPLRVVHFRGGRGGLGGAGGLGDGRGQGGRAGRGGLGGPPPFQTCATLQEAVEAGNLVEAARLITPNSVNAPDQHGFTPLLHAARHGLLEMIRLLLSRGADLNSRGPYGATALHYAAKHSHPRAAELLLSSGADVNAAINYERQPVRDAPSAPPRSPGATSTTSIQLGVQEEYAGPKRGWTPLHVAARSRDGREAVQLALVLLSRGANVNAVDEERSTPLHLAVQAGGSRSIVELLLSRGANVNAVDEKWSSPLHLAVRAGDSRSIVELLLSRGANVNAVDEKWSSPLHLAVQAGGSRSIVELLVAHGADTDAMDGRHRTPLLIAAEAMNRTHDQTVTQFLLSSGADVHAKEQDGVTALHYAASEPLGADTVHELLVRGADVNATTTRGQTPLHCVRSEEAAAHLLDKGADAAADLNGCTPLHVAVSSGQVAVLQRLIARVNSVDVADAAGWTPLHVAACKGNVDMEANEAMLKALLRAGADLEARTNTGLTPLHCSALGPWGHTVASVLLAEGNDEGNAKSGKIDVNARDSAGCTPLHRAVLQGEHSLAALLVAFGADTAAHDSFGNVPLHYVPASVQRSTSGFATAHVLRRLPYFPSRLEERDDMGRTALHCAVLYDLQPFVQVLLERGADPSPPDYCGETPLHYAAGWGRVGATERLLAAGAEVNAADVTGCTPVDAAVAEGRKATLDLLLKAGGKGGVEGRKRGRLVKEG